MIEVRRIKSISAHACAGMTDRKGSSPKIRFRAKTFLAIGRISHLLSPFLGGVLSQLFVIGQKKGSRVCGAFLFYDYRGGDCTISATFF